MSSKSDIEWTEHTWNPTIGCSKVSPGCRYCYAEAMAKRLQAIGTAGYENGFELTILRQRLQQPFLRKKPTMFFVNSMSDLFHEQIPLYFIDEIFSVIQQTQQHTYQILTKRSDRMRDYFISREVPENAWLGVTVENKKHGKPRIADLRDQCNTSDTAFFFKQWGVWGSDGKRRSKKTNGRLLSGRIWNEYPTFAINAHHG